MTCDQLFVESGDHGLSLLQFLKGRLAHSGKAIKRAIDSNGCFVNGRVERFSSSRVKQGDLVAITIERGRKKEEVKFDLLYEDQTLRAVNKLPGYPSTEEHTLHRLDKETSGVLLCSDDQAYYNLFRKRQMKKTYLAVVQGKIRKKSDEINFPIGVRKRYQGHKIMQVDSEGKEAVTYYDVIKQEKDYSVLIVRPKTGRTHQIRVHLAAVSLHILGDFDYGKKFSIGAPRMLLHAYEVSFRHPHTKESISIKAPIPDDLSPYLTESELQEAQQGHVVCSL